MTDWTIGYGRSQSPERLDTDGSERAITKLGPVQIGHNHWDGSYFEVSEAHARLMLAAPKLLLACREAWFYIDGLDEWHKSLAEELADAVQAAGIDPWAEYTAFEELTK